jgi:hypothetical protein
MFLTNDPSVNEEGGYRPYSYQFFEELRRRSNTNVPLRGMKPYPGYGVNWDGVPSPGQVSAVASNIAPAVALSTKANVANAQPVIPASFQVPPTPEIVDAQTQQITSAIMPAVNAAVVAQGAYSAADPFQQHASPDVPPTINQTQMDAVTAAITPAVTAAATGSEVTSAAIAPDTVHVPAPGEVVNVSDIGAKVKAALSGPDGWKYIAGGAVLLWLLFRRK